MIAVKGFHSHLECTMGEGTFRYEVGKKYTEGEAQCASRGFHYVEEPIEVLRWYGGQTDRYCIVEAGGDIHEDGMRKGACTEITILREISPLELGILECRWLQGHPDREYSRRVHREENQGYSQERIVVVRGKHPRAAGCEGAVLFLLEEEPGSRRIAQVGVYEVDGEDYLPGVYYGVDGGRCGQ